MYGREASAIWAASRELRSSVPATMQTISLADRPADRARSPGASAPRPAGRVDRRHVRRLFAAVGVVQIDSVNVIVRSQELPLWARLGAHRRDLLTGMAADNELFEYWAHMASLVPIELHPLFRWRMEQAKEGEGTWTGWRSSLAISPDSSKTCTSWCASADPLRPESSRAKTVARSRGGAGATPSSRSSTCSGAVGSRRGGGPTSNASTTSPNG